MTAITQALSAALLHFVWQGMLVAVLLWTALFLLRKRSPNARYVASCVALATMAGLPAITTWVLYQGPASVIESTDTMAAVMQTTQAGMPVPPTTWLGILQAWALPAWSLGVLLFSLRLVWGWKQVATLRRCGDPANPAVGAAITGLAERMGITRPVRALMSSMAESPSVVGWIRPVILLPAATIVGLTPEQLEAVLAHELAHIRRYDYLVNIVQILVETVLFYHPAIWWASARVRHERELCCDDLAVRSCGDTVCYARALTKLERLRLTTPSMAMGSTDGPLAYRIQRLLGAKTQEYAPSKLPGILALCLGLACFALNIHWARGQAQESQNPEARVAVVTVDSQVRDSAGVRVELGGSAVLHRTPVGYPEAAMKKGIRGTVAVEVTLDDSGNVSDARVLSGPAELRKTALESVLRWHFTRDGAGITRQVSIEFEPPAPGKRPEERQELQTVRRFESERKNALGEASAAEAEARRSRQLVEVKQALDEQQRAATQQQSPEALQQVKSLIAELETTLREVDASRPEHTELSARSMAGRRLTSIGIEGLSEQARAELVSRLPVKVGDVLSSQSIEASQAAVKNFDEHLQLRMEVIEAGEVSFRITAPGGERVFVMRK